MSIIAEALKKAQETHKEARVGPSKPPEPSKTTPRKPPLPRTKKRAFPFYIYARAAIIVAFLSVAVFLFYLSKQYSVEEKIAPPEEKAESQSYVLWPAETPEEKFPVVPKPITLNRVSEEINLSGIMYTPQRPLAVINGNIWSEGDEVGNYRILQIGKNFIKVSRDGEEFEIRLKR